MLSCRVHTYISKTSPPLPKSPTTPPLHCRSAVSLAEKLKASGVDEIVCVATNDAFAMHAWGVEHGAAGKVRMLADPHAHFVTALGVDIPAHPKLGGTRSKRFAMVVDDGAIAVWQLEPPEAPTGLTCSLAPHLEGLVSGLPRRG